MSSLESCIRKRKRSNDNYLDLLPVELVFYITQFVHKDDLIFWKRVSPSTHMSCNIINDSKSMKLTLSICMKSLSRVQFAINQYNCSPDSAYTRALILGSLEIVEYLLHNYNLKNHEEIFIIHATSKRHLHLLQWYHANYGLQSPSHCTLMCKIALYNNDCPILQFIIDFKMYLEIDTTNSKCLCNFDLIVYLRNRGCQWTNRSVQHVVRASSRLVESKIVFLVDGTNNKSL